MTGHGYQLDAFANGWSAYDPNIGSPIPLTSGTLSSSVVDMKSSTTLEGTMTRPAHITDLHVERGEQMRHVVAYDITQRGLSFEAAVESLAGFLGIDAESVRLGIAIANEWGDPQVDPIRAHNARVQQHYAAARA